MGFVAPRLLAVAAALALAACGGKTTDASQSSTGGISSCTSGGLAGATYDIARSKFAFGGAPAHTVDGPIARWVGPDGVVAIFSSGSAMGIMNGGAPETALPDFSADPEVLRAHVVDYFRALGIDACQVADTQVLAGSGGRTISLNRAVDGIRIVESNAYARFDSDDQTTSEALYWPAISASVVDQARSFRDLLRDPAALAAYRAKLPPEARGDGNVVIHHSSSFDAGAFRAWATWEVFVPNPMGMGGDRDYDRDGNLVPASP